MVVCHYCGAHAPYSCDAPDESGKPCGRLVCADHSVPQVEGAKDIGKATLCDDHAHLQKRKRVRVDNGSSPGTALRPTLTFTPLEIDGITHQLRFDVRALRKAEADTKANLLHGIAGLLNHNTSFSEYCALLYAAMLKARPDITIDDASELIFPDSLPDIHMALLVAYNESLPEKHKILRPPAAEEEGENLGLKDISATENSGDGSGQPPEST